MQIIDLETATLLLEAATIETSTDLGHTVIHKGSTPAGKTFTLAVTTHEQHFLTTRSSGN